MNVRSTDSLPWVALISVLGPAGRCFLQVTPSTIFRTTHSIWQQRVVRIDGDFVNSKKTDNPHQRTRRDHASETAEDYVEAIAEVIAAKGVCRANDLARRFAVSHVTVHRIVSRLQDEGLLDTEPYRPIQLTTKGKRLARKSRQRHEMVYKFLLAIGVDPATAETDAEGIEHHVSPKTLECFRSIVDRLSGPSK